MTDPEFLPDRKTTGTMARRLAGHLERAHKLRLKHTQAIDALAAALGLRNRHELAERQPDETPPSGTPLNTAQRIVTIFYAGGAHQHADSREAAESAGDPLLTLMVRLAEDADPLTAAGRFNAASHALGVLADYGVPAGSSTHDMIADWRRRAPVMRLDPGPDGLDKLAAFARHASRGLITDTARLQGRIDSASRTVKSLAALLHAQHDEARRLGRSRDARRLIETGSDIRRIASRIVRRADDRQAFIVAFADGSALEARLDQPHRAAWTRRDLAELDGGIAAGQLVVAPENETRILLDTPSVIRLVNAREIDWFSPQDRWMLSPEQLLAKLEPKASEAAAPNPRQVLLLRLYDAGAHAGLTSAGEIRRRKGDHWLAHLFETLAEARSDEHAYHLLDARADRVRAVLSRYDVDGIDPIELEDFRGGLDGFQRAVMETLGVDANALPGDPFVRQLTHEVSEARGVRDFAEFLTVLRTLAGELRELAGAFRAHGQGANPRPVRKPEADLPLIRDEHDLARLLVRATDNRGATADRYSLQFTDGDGLVMSANPDSPVGVSQWTEIDPSTLAQGVQTGAEFDITLNALPANVLAHAIDRANEAYGEGARDKMRRGLTRQEVLQQLDEDRFALCGPEFMRRVL